MSNKITAYKMCEKDRTCRGFQYEVGQTYTHNGKVEVCRSGFHACKNPMDCCEYRDIAESRFAVVEQSGDIDRKEEDTKAAARTITIKKELSLHEFIQHCVDWAMKNEEEKADFSHQVSSGRGVSQISSGIYVHQASSGYNVSQISSGIYAHQASSGPGVRQASSGIYAHQTSAGIYAHQASSGPSARQASSGDYARHVSSGDGVRQISSGDYARHFALGSDSVIASSGNGARAKGCAGTWISLAEFDNGKCIGFAVGCVGSDGIKPDTWYVAKDGKLTEEKS